MRCPNASCGRTMDADAAYCSNCGSATRSASTHVPCGWCGRLTDRGEYCSTCGRRLADCPAGIPWPAARAFREWFTSAGMMARKTPGPLRHSKSRQSFQDAGFPANIDDDEWVLWGEKFDLRSRARRAVVLIGALF